MRVIFIFITIISIALKISAQNNSINKKDLIIYDFIKSYNYRDYKKMKRNLFFIGKVVVSKNKMKETFTEIYDVWGKFTVKKISHLSETKTEVRVVSQRDTTETEMFNFFFNKKNKLTGFFIKKADFYYPLNKKATSNGLLTNEKSRKIDSLISKKGREGNFNGSVLVIDSGNAIYKNNYGYSNFEKKAILNDSSVFYLASCSKQFTAMAIMILAEKGKLKYSDTIQKFIPDFPYKNITIENLLTHTSGLPDYMTLMGKYWDKQKQANNYDVVNTLFKIKPAVYFKPGENFDYSNTGYVILGIIIEKSSGVSFNEFMTKNIFNPIGMNHTFVGGSSKEAGDKLPNWAYGYVYSNSLKEYVIPEKLNWYQFVTYLDPIFGDGNINSTITDLAKWEKSLRENVLVTKTTLNISYTKYKLKNGEITEYGYGECISDKMGMERVVYHSGGWQGYRSFILRLVNKDLSIVVLSNNEYVSFNQLVDEIALILLN